MLRWFLLILTFTFILLPCPAFSQNTGIERMTDLWGLPDQELGTFSFGESSTDWLGGNMDGFIGLYSRIYYEDGKHILYDSQGPGCIYRMWFTLLRPASELEFYFDGEQSPSLTLHQSQMFDESSSPFFSPLTWDDDESSGGFVSYIPICYEEHLKIAATKNIFFHNFNATRYFEGTEVSTYTGQEDYSKAETIFDPINAGADPKDTDEVDHYSTFLYLAPSESAPFIEETGAGQIASIKLTPEILDEELLNNVYLTATFDDAEQPQVNALLGAFFGTLASTVEVHSLLFGLKDGILYCFFPMPYLASAEVSIRNESERAINLDLEYEILDQPPDDHAGHFYTDYKLTSPTIFGQDIQLANPEGQGKIVGVVQIAGGYSGQTYMEGDERYYPDGLLSPTVYGTGTEDYYNGGWYYDRGPFTLPTHGAPMEADLSGLFVTANYRLHIADSLNFSNGAVFSIEHDLGNIATDEIEHTCTFMYQIPEPSLVLEDTFDIGNSDDEARFGYKGTGDTYVSEQSYFYEGDNDLVPIGDDGYISQTGASFTILVNPANDGVRLVRRVDQNEGRELLRVWVNGQDAGIWNTPHQNPFKRWLDTVFDIPPTLTKGERELDIELENIAVDRSFTQFHYWFYSWKKPILSRMEELVLSCPGEVFHAGDTVDLTLMGAYPSGNQEEITGWASYTLSASNLAEESYGRLELLAPGQLTISAYTDLLESNEITITILPADSDDDDDDDDNDDDLTGDDDDDDDNDDGGNCGC